MNTYLFTRSQLSVNPTIVRSEWLIRSASEATDEDNECWIFGMHEALSVEALCCRGPVSLDLFLYLQPILIDFLLLQLGVKL